MVNPEYADALQQYIFFLAIVMQNIDFVNWHIQDAIREEIYQDPDFQ